MVKDKSDDADVKKKKLVQEIYGTDENPLSYIIEPRDSIKITDKNHKTKKEDLENIL